MAEEPEVQEAPEPVDDWVTPEKPNFMPGNGTKGLPHMTDEWWKTFIDMLAHGQKMGTAIDEANAKAGFDKIGKSIYYGSPTPHNNPPSLSYLACKDPYLKSCIDRAKAHMIKMARRTIVPDVTKPAGAWKYLERRDPEFIPKAKIDRFDTMDEDELDAALRELDGSGSDISQARTAAEEMGEED